MKSKWFKGVIALAMTGFMASPAYAGSESLLAKQATKRVQRDQEEVGKR